jgi:transposase
MAWAKRAGICAGPAGTGSGCGGLAAAGSARQVVARFEVSVSYVVKARRRAHSSHTSRLLAGLHHVIEAQVERHGDATLAELREWLQPEHGVSASTGLMWNTPRRLGLTLRERLYVPPSRGVPMSRKPAASGRSVNPVSTLRRWPYSRRSPDSSWS